MGKSLFLASTDSASQRSKAVDAFLAYCGSQCGTVGYFKTVVKDPDNNARIKELAAQKGVAPREVYGVSLQEAVTYLNSGREAALIEEVLARYSHLATKFDPILIEGACLTDVAAYVLQGLDAVLAANLASPVVLISGSGACLAGSGVRYY
ncbi:MAG: AAA family ATPase, partial [Deltaproteobacteria bacterium]|nr:AAA family ATPase [Deltaproteobacteria bacterium]